MALYFYIISTQSQGPGELGVRHWISLPKVLVWKLARSSSIPLSSVASMRDPGLHCSLKPPLTCRSPLLAIIHQGKLSLPHKWNHLYHSQAGRNCEVWWGISYIIFSLINWYWMNENVLNNFRCFVSGSGLWEGLCSGVSVLCAQFAWAAHPWSCFTT